MVTTSPQRGFSVPTVGADTGAWGGELNSTIIDLDSILGGTLVLASTIATNVTLATSQAQIGYISVSSATTLASSFSINFFSSNFAIGNYIINNASSAAGFNVTCFSSAGTTGLYTGSSAIIPPQSTRMITSDGVGDVFLSDITPTSTGGAVFPSGTNMLFQQTAAPSGWTKVTTYNDTAIRIVSSNASSGGTNGFSTVFAQTTVGNTTLTSSQLPNQTHRFNFFSGAAATCGSPYVMSQVQVSPCPVTDVPAMNTVTNAHSDNTVVTDLNGGGAHTHSITMGILYVDCIIATKN